MQNASLHLTKEQPAATARLVAKPKPASGAITPARDSGIMRRGLGLD
jgi:hypothetical protein